MKVAVVGGVTGLSIAFNLAERGADVVVFERTRIAAEASEFLSPAASGSSSGAPRTAHQPDTQGPGAALRKQLRLPFRR